MSNATAPRFYGSRPLTNGAGKVLAIEMLVRLGDLEARALARPGSEPEWWEVKRAGRWSAKVDLHDMRRLHRGRALAKVCARLESMERAAA